MDGGRQHQCMIALGNTAYCWGRNDHGALGTGDFVPRRRPTPFLGTQSNSREVTLGRYSTCVVTLDSNLWCTGEFHVGASGEGHVLAGGLATPVEVVNTGDVTSAMCGYTHCCLITSAFDIKCFGRNYRAACGTGNNSPSIIATPLTVTAYIATALPVEVEGGVHYTCVLDQNKNIQCFGKNSSGQLGRSTTSAYEGTSAFVLNQGSSGASVRLKAGRSSCCALTDLQAAFCWGKGSKGQLGDGLATASSTPVDVSGVTTALEIFGGMDAPYSCVKLTSGEVKCWGRECEFVLLVYLTYFFCFFSFDSVNCYVVLVIFFFQEILPCY
jgi:alpha-tubulin suppressor-like RCC1 family protein